MPRKVPRLGPCSIRSSGRTFRSELLGSILADVRPAKGSEPEEEASEHLCTQDDLDPTPVGTLRKFPSNTHMNSLALAHEAQQVALLENERGKEAEAETEGDEDRSHPRQLLLYWKQTSFPDLAVREDGQGGGPQGQHLIQCPCTRLLLQSGTTCPHTSR